MRVAFGEYQLDTETRTLQREGQRIPVQSKAFDLLAYLIERRARVVSSDELLDALWPGLHVLRRRCPQRYRKPGKQSATTASTRRCCKPSTARDSASWRR